MRVVITGSSGRVGRAIFNAIAGKHDVLGIDRTPFSTTHVVGDFADEKRLRSAFRNADAVIHTAALHAPHVGAVADSEFYRINVDGTRLVAEAAIAEGLKRIVFTSTTALYGYAISNHRCTWIDEDTLPQPKSIYHTTKLAAEQLLEEIANPIFNVRILRMSRSFPEPADAMAVHRLNRGVDIRDVADAHLLALTNSGAHFQRYIISATSPFTREDCSALETDAAALITSRIPFLAAEFNKRGWHLPSAIDRIYCNARAGEQLGWSSKRGFDEVLSQLDRRSLEVLPVTTSFLKCSE